MKKSTLLAAVASVFGIATIAQAVPAKPYELIISGIGANDNDFNETTFSAQARLGYYVDDNSQHEFSLRQTVIFSDAGGPGGSLDGLSAVGYDYHFDFGQDQRLIPFVGANIGYRYGDVTDDSVTAAPEAGVKFYVNDTTFIFGQVSYDFLLKESFGDGAFNYALGVGFRF